MNSSRLRQELARAEARSLTLRAKNLAAGWAAGAHRAERKGSGVEFAGHRAYTPGDDLRHLDRHAFLRHGRLLVREFLTDTERPLHLIVDATSSMNYRGQEPTARPSKAEIALLLAAAIAFIGQRGGDHVGLTTVSETETFSARPRGGREAFERALHQLETLDERTPTQSAPSRTSADSRVDWNHTFASLGASLPRGTLILAFSDFLDTQQPEQRSLAALATQRRSLRAVQILTPDEVEFPFDGSVRLRDPETGKEVETDAGPVRKQYQAALAALTDSLKAEITRQGGEFLRFLTGDSVELSLRALAGGAFPGQGGRP